VTVILVILYFKLLPFFECRLLYSGLFPGVCILNSNVSVNYEDGTAECLEMLAFKLQTPGNNPEESIKYSCHILMILEYYRQVLGK
jgi:hypothetical protein